jgi:hypothetical protein
MKDIMQKLAELEATAPKITKKKMLNEDSTTPPMNVSDKPASLKDIFETMAMQKPIPVVGKQGDMQQTGAGFLNVTDNSPAAQALSNALGDLATQKKVQIVMPTQPGQQATAAGQPAQAGATGQAQPGQMQMKEKDEGKPGKNFAKIAKSAGARYGSKEAGERVAGAVRAKLAKQGKLEEENLDEISKGKAMQALQYAASDPDDERGYTMQQKIGKKWPEMKKHAADAAYTSVYGRSDRDTFQDPDKLAARAKTSYRMNKGGTANKQDLKARFRREVDEGDIAPTDGIDTKGAGLGAGRSMTTLEGKKGVNPFPKKDDKASTKAPAKGKKPDFLDLDKDGNKKEPMKKAAADKKKLKEDEMMTSYFVILDDNLIDQIAQMDGAVVDPDAGTVSSTNQNTVRQLNAFAQKNPNRLKKSSMVNSAGVKPMAQRVGGTSSGPEYNLKENKKKVKESMNHRISAARLEGESHGLRGHSHSGKRYDDLEEFKAYHEGYKKGLDECYGQGVYETAPAMPAATVPGMAAQTMQEAGMEAFTRTTFYNPKTQGDVRMGNLNDAIKYKNAGWLSPDTEVSYYHPRNHVEVAVLAKDAPHLASLFGTNEGEMDEGNAFTAALAKTPKGGKFAVGGKTFTDRTGYDAKVNEYAFESLDQQLNALLNESEEVSEGLSVSISKGQQNSPDSVTITAQDQEAEHLLAFVKNAGLGLFGDDNADTHSSAMSVQPSHGAPDEVGAGGIDIGVVDGHDGMMGLMQKLSGIQSGGAEDYADEEGDEEQLYGNHETADKKDCGCDGDCECSDYDQPSNEDTCNECGGMMEAGHSCGSKEMVDEVESEDQMEFEVSEDNAPDSEEAEHTADEDAEAQEDAALAKSDSKGGTYTVNEGGDGGEASEEGPESKEGETDEEGETVSESFANLFRKLAFIAEESTEKEDDKAEKAGKKVAKDIEYDEGHKGKDDNKAEKAGKKVTKDIEYDDKKDKKEKVDESQLDEIFGLGGTGKKDSAMRDVESIASSYGVYGAQPDNQGVVQFRVDLRDGSAADVYANPKEPMAHITFSKNSKYKPGQQVKFDLLNHVQAKMIKELNAAFAAARGDGQEPVNEWANNAGPGKTVSDTTFEQDIDFMTKVIAGGLNKPKSTGQTTIPVIAGQDDRMHDNPMDWATLAGIKK